MAASPTSNPDRSTPCSPAKPTSRGLPGCSGQRQPPGPGDDSAQLITVASEDDLVAIWPFALITIALIIAGAVILRLWVQPATELKRVAGGGVLALVVLAIGVPFRLADTRRLRRIRCALGESAGEDLSARIWALLPQLRCINPRLATKEVARTLVAQGALGTAVRIALPRMRE
jgi:hypothetical protein